MTLDTLIALIGISATAAFTPGPNNMLLTASGANFGVRRTLPHILGVGFGFAFMIFIVGFFLAALFEQSPAIREILRWAGVVLLLYIAWKVASSGGLGSKKRRARPFSFLEAAAFQWVNPKGWAMAIAITANFVTAAAPFKSAMIVSLVFIATGIASASCWAIAGKAITRWINTEVRLRVFNGVLGATIAAFVVVLIIG